MLFVWDLPQILLTPSWIFKTPRVAMDPVGLTSGFWKFPGSRVTWTKFPSKNAETHIQITTAVQPVRANSSLAFSRTSAGIVCCFWGIFDSSRFSFKINGFLHWYYKTQFILNMKSIFKGNVALVIWFIWQTSALVWKKEHSHLVLHYSKWKLIYKPAK